MSTSARGAGSRPCDSRPGSIGCGATRCSRRSDTFLGAPAWSRPGAGCSSGRRSRSIDTTDLLAGRRARTSPSSPAPPPMSTGGGRLDAAQLLRVGPEEIREGIRRIGRVVAGSRSSSSSAITGEHPTTAVPPRRSGPASGGADGSRPRRPVSGAGVRMRVAVLKGGRGSSARSRFRSGARVEDALTSLGARGRRDRRRLRSDDDAKGGAA